jgi:integrase
MNRLTARFVATVKRAGRHGDGGGLYLSVSGTGSKSWVFIWQRDGKRCEIGLGSLTGVTLARARELAQQARADVAAGTDPRERRGRRHVPSFGECADRCLEDIEAGWSSAKHRRQWQRSLTVEAAALRGVPVDAVSTDMVLSVLKPGWISRNPSSERLRLRIERVLDWARAKNLRTGENPARWRGHLQRILPKPPRATRHHAAMAYENVPAFWVRLTDLDTYGSRALRLIILTAVRAGEALGARWSEVDLDGAVWAIPAERMKGRRAHRVPLSAPALALLRELHGMRINEYVFPGVFRRPMVAGSLFSVLRRPPLCLRNVTVHGFRSSFRDWAGDRGVAREIAEAALAHTVGNQVERAYRRGDAFEQRRQLMDSWAMFITNEPAKVITLRR